jgi:transposase
LIRPEESNFSTYYKRLGPFSKLAISSGIDLRFHPLDTTSFSLSGEYVPDSDEHAMTMTHGYAKDHRPDLQQAVLELMVSQDGGGPFVSQSWDGKTSDLQIFQERAQAWMHAFTHTPSPRYLVADAKLYHADNAASLNSIGFITRIPNTLGVVAQVIRPALGWDTWQPVDDHPLAAA